MKLIIDNATCQLVGFNVKQFNEIRRILSYMETARTRYGGFNYVRQYLLDKRGNFSTGLLYLVEEYLAKHKIEVERQDKRIRPKTGALGLETMFLPGKCPTPYPEQIESAKACYDSEDGRGIVVAPTGTGKTLITALICDKLQVSTLILVPNLDLKTQTISALRGYFGEDKVGPLEKGKRKYFITIENYDALQPKKEIEGFQAVIVDEQHHSASKTLRTLSTHAWKNVYFRFGLTATNFRSNPEERLLLESVLSKVVYEIPYKTAVAKGYIVPMQVYYAVLPTIKCKSKNYTGVYNELVVNREDRNNLIAQVAAGLDQSGISSIVLTKQVEHGRKLQKLIKDLGVDAGYIHGESDINRQLLLEFNLCERRTLVGTTGCLGEGSDSKPAEWVILATTVKSKNLYMQMLGRSFRRYTYPDGRQKESCKILMFYDPSHKYMVEHFRACQKYLKEEYGIKPERIEL